MGSDVDTWFPWGPAIRRSGDRHAAASEDGAATERDELMEAWWLFARMHRTYRYSFSLYLPADFPIISTRLVLAQWKQVCEWTKCRPQNPVLAIRYQNGELFVARQDEHARFILYRKCGGAGGLSIRNEIFELARGPNRWLAEWRTDRSLHGPTVYQPQPDYPAHGFVYFKTGLYRDEMQQPITIYVDEYRKDELTQ